jgi:hypothetical protein
VGQQIPLHLPTDLNMEYVNLVRIAHSPSELVFDFAQMLPGEAGAQVTSRIVMAPLSAKLLLRALADNLSRFETAFGEIKVPGDTTLADHLFHPENPKGLGDP